MIKSLFLVAAIAIAAPAIAQTASLEQVQKALAATTSMKASFVQTASAGGTATGTMTMKRPGRIRFDYGAKSSQLVVADGSNLSFVDYKVAQVSQWPLRQTPLGVLLDPKADLARVARVLPEAESPLPGQIAVEARDAKRPEIGRIIFFLKPDRSAPGGMMLTGWRVIDAQNNLTVVELSNIQTNIDVSNSVFRFRDPRRPIIGKG